MGADVFRWVIAGRFSPSPSGAAFRANDGEWAALIERRCGTVSARVADRIGAAEARELSMEVKSVRAFSVPGVLEGVPELRALQALAAAPPATAEAFLAEVENLSGRGRLWDGCAEALERARAKPAAAVDLVDDLLSGAGARKTEAARAVDAFIAAHRAGGAGAGAAPAADPAAVAIRAQIVRALHQTALDFLASDAVRPLEANWRGLRMVVERCPSSGEIRIEALDASPAQALARLREPSSGEFDEPDAIFVVDPVRTAAEVRAWGEIAEAASAPCVVAIDPGVLGARGVEELRERSEAGDPPPEEWAEVRAEAAARWVCAALNRVVVAAESSEAGERVSSASAAFAVAAMLASTWKANGSFGGVVGRPGAISAPAMWAPPGARRPLSIPTEAFLPIAPQKELAGWGVLALGSERDSDRIVLAAAPMASSARGAFPLAAQLFAGRVVRFARWVGDQVSPEMDAAAVSAVYEQAAGLFLFPGAPAAAATLKAAVSSNAGTRTVHVTAAANAAQAGIPLTLEFDLSI